MKEKIHEGRPFLNTFQIGPLAFSMPLILAPLAGVSDLPFRMMQRRYGCELAFTEMISARSLVYGSKQSLSMLATHETDRPLGVQLLGNDPEMLVRALDILHPMPFCMVDINAACPVPKVTSRGEGAGLLREEPKRIGALVEAVVRATHWPVTIKIRTGWTPIRSWRSTWPVLLRMQGLPASVSTDAPACSTMAGGLTGVRLPR